MDTLKTLDMINIALDSVGLKLTCIGMALLIVSMIIFSIALFNIDKISKKWLHSNNYTKDTKGEEINEYI